MPFSRSELDSHGLWSSLETARISLNKALSNADAEEGRLIADWHQAFTFTERLHDVEPWRFTQSGQVLASLATHVDALITELRPLIEDETASIAPTIQARLDAYSGVLITAPLLAVTSGHLSGVTANVERVSEAVAKAIGDIRSRTDENLADVTDTYDQLVADLEAVKVDLTAQKSRLDAAITDQTDRFGTNLQDWKNQVEAAIEDADAKAAEARRVESDRASQQVSELESLLNKSRDMVNVTARNTISTEYAQYARRQGLAATAWSCLAVIVAVGGIVALFVLIRNVTQLTMAESIFKATLSTAVLGTAAFMGREAAGHRREARDAKRTQLDMNTLEPFLSTLSDEDAGVLRRQFAFRVFNRPLANISRGVGGGGTRPAEDHDEQGD